VRQAISIGKQVDPYRLFWLEDVTAPDDYDGLARVANALDTPIACGEYLYGIAPFRQMLESRSVDIVMIDVLRAGGITQWLKIAGMAEAFNIPVVSHLAPEIHVHLVSAIPNGLTVEYMPWSFGLFREVPQPKDGQLTVPLETGTGAGVRSDNGQVQLIAATAKQKGRNDPPLFYVLKFLMFTAGIRTSRRCV